MADSPGDSDSDSDRDPDQNPQPSDGPILSPDELDISDSEHVEQLDEDRFVVSPDARVDSTPDGPQGGRDAPSGSDRTPERESGAERDPTPDATGSASPGMTAGDLTEEAVHEWLRASFEENTSRYGFDITATFDGSVTQRRMASNDVVTIFESLILWYAQQVDADTPVEKILGILLMEASVPVRYPTGSLKALVRSAGLGPDDTIADLLAAVDDDGLEL